MSTHRVWDLNPEALELIYEALRYYRFWKALEPEQRALALKIEELIETWLRD